MAAVRPQRAADPTTEPGGDLPARLQSVVRALAGDARRREKAAEALGLGAAGRAALAEGPHLVAEAAAAGLAVVLVAATARALAEPEVAMAVAALRGRGASVYRVPEALLARLAATRSPRGVLAVVELAPPGGAADLAAAWNTGRGGLVLGLAGVQDPGNVGSLARTARAVGAPIVAADGRTARADDAKTLRASQGALFHLGWACLEAGDMLEAARASGAVSVAAVPRGGDAPWSVDLRGPLLFLLGGEGAGLGDEVAAAADRRVTLPMRAGESLGVAAAGAALLYEYRRQGEP